MSVVVDVNFLRIFFFIWWLIPILDILSSIGGDVLGNESTNNSNTYNDNRRLGSDVSYPNNSLASSSNSNSNNNNNNDFADPRQAALDRQRELAMQKAKQRMMGNTTINSTGDMNPGNTSSRTLTRAAPSSVGYQSSSSATASSSQSTFPQSNNVTLNSSNSNESTGSTLIDALRERQKRNSRDGIMDNRSIEQELQQRGILSSYDPTNFSNDMSASSTSSSVINTSIHSRIGTSLNNSMDDPNQSPNDAPILPANIPVSMPLTSSSSNITGRAGDTNALVFSDMRKFLTTPTPKSAGVVQCYIERDKSSMANKLYPLYCLYMVDGDRFLLGSKKRTNNKTSNYLLSMDKRDLNRESPSFMGKVRANFVGTEFTIYDDGASPDPKATTAPTTIRQELGIINYASNVLGSRGPRKMKVAVPKVLPDGRSIVFQPDNEEDSMLAKFRAGYIQDMALLINKPPKWNDQVGAYVLNFYGRVTMASVKNFQLVSPDDHDTVVLQFGRTGKDTFSMDYQWPLSPLQAFAICLSSFDYKLACE